jgi:hypothetical protein
MLAKKGHGNFCHRQVQIPSSSRFKDASGEHGGFVEVWGARREDDDVELRRERSQETVIHGKTVMELYSGLAATIKNTCEFALLL